MQKKLGFKIAIIFIVGLAVYFPTTLVKYKIYERQEYLEEAKKSVMRSSTSPQTIITPVIIIPYFTSPLPHATNRELIKQFSVVVAESVTTTARIDNSALHKGIYEIPIYNSHAVLSGVFSNDRLLTSLEETKSKLRFAAFDKPYLAIHISDMRGIIESPTLTINDISMPLESSSKIAGLENGLHSILDTPSDENGEMHFNLGISLRGMDNLSIVSLSENSSVTFDSNWPHPEFTGSSLPMQRNISAAGFSAKWTSTRFANNYTGLLTQCIEQVNCYPLLNTASGVSFIDPVDIYLQSERSIKYAALFIGLSFIAFFIFEHLRKIRIHPIQYTFVGLAIAVFYLLLISLAEHIAFIWAYGIATISCTSLILFYLRHMLKSAAAAALFSAMLLSLYGLLFVIIQAEDFALLMGSGLVFIALSILMYVTRHLDWYNLSSDENTTLTNK